MTGKIILGIVAVGVLVLVFLITKYKTGNN